MAVTVTFPIDPVQLDALTDAGYTTLTLWYSNTPDGVYANTGASPSPATIALMISGETYLATFTYSAGNPAQWFKVRAYDGANYSDLSLSSPFQGGGGSTLSYIRQKLGAEIHDMRVGTLTSGTSTTSAVTSTTDIFRFGTNFFYGALLNNTTRSGWSNITASVQGGSSTTITIATAIASQASGDAIEITRRFSPLEYRDAINWAILASSPVLVKNIVHTGYVASTTQKYQYEVPQDITNVLSVEVESWNQHTSTDASVRGFPWSAVPFKIIYDGLRQKIELGQWVQPDLRLRITGTGPLSQLYNDSDYVEVVDPQLQLIIYLAAYRLYNAFSNDAAATDIDRYVKLAAMYWEKAQAMKQSYNTIRPAKQGWSAEVRGGHRSTLIGSFNPSSFDSV